MFSDGFIQEEEENVEKKADARTSRDFNNTALFSQRSLSSSIKRKEHKTHLEFYECRSDDEKDRDQVESYS